MRLIAGNNSSLDLVGSIRFRFQLAGNILLHALGLGKDLPVDNIIGGERHRPTECTIIYLWSGKDTFQLGKSLGERSDANGDQLLSPEDPQLQFNSNLSAAAGHRLDYSMLMSDA